MASESEPAACVEALDLSDPAVAERLHAVHRAAYAQEAELLGARHFPPRERTLEQLRAGSDSWLGVRRDAALAGAIAIEPGDTPGSLHIAALVVAPEHQRFGLGRRLVEAVIERAGLGSLTVSTGAANKPALALYAALGFVEERRSTVGFEALPVIRLRRSSGAATDR